jgi:hypothetical protein
MGHELGDYFEEVVYYFDDVSNNRVREHIKECEIIWK